MVKILPRSLVVQSSPNLFESDNEWNFRLAAKRTEVSELHHEFRLRTVMTARMKKKKMHEFIYNL